MSVTSPPLAISTGIGTLLIRQLDSSDGADLQALCQRCHDYFELVTGHPVGPAEAQSLFSSLPEGKTYEDKFLLGVFRGSAVVGVIDLIRGWRRNTSWTLGLLLLDPAVRSHGVGRAIVDELDRWVSSEGGLVMRLGVVERNARAVDFWRRMGFLEMERKQAEYGLTLTMERPVGSVSPS